MMNIKPLLKWILAFFLALLLLKLLVTRWTVFTPQDVSPSPTNPIRAILEDLAMCESGLNPAAVHLNDGAPGSHSIGILQFKRGTFGGYWRQLINKNVEEVDIDNLWPDPDNQYLLARAMLANNPKNLHHWEVCSTRLKLFAKLSTPTR